MVLAKSGLTLPAAAWGGFALGRNDQAPNMKTERINEPASRREFLRGGARYALLAGLGAVSATLVKRSGGRLSGQSCINQGICRGCGAFTACGLPQALSAKQAGQISKPPQAERGVRAASASHHQPAMKRTEVRAPEANHET